MARGSVRLPPATAWLEDAVLGGRFLLWLPAFLRSPVNRPTPRRSCTGGSRRGRADFLALARTRCTRTGRAPYRKLLDHAGCQYADLERLVRTGGSRGRPPNARGPGGLPDGRGAPRPSAGRPRRPPLHPGARRPPQSAVVLPRAGPDRREPRSERRAVHRPPVHSRRRGEFRREHGRPGRRRLGDRVLGRAGRHDPPTSRGRQGGISAAPLVLPGRPGEPGGPRALSLERAGHPLGEPARRRRASGARARAGQRPGAGRPMDPTGPRRRADAGPPRVLEPRRATRRGSARRRARSSRGPSADLRGAGDGAPAGGPAPGRRRGAAPIHRDGDVAARRGLHEAGSGGRRAFPERPARPRPGGLGGGLLGLPPRRSS